MSQTMVDTSHRLQAFVNDTTGDGTLSRDVRETAATLRDASQRIRQMAADLQGVINKDTASEARETVREARAVVQRAGSMLGRFEGAGGPGGFSLRNFAGVEYNVWYSGQRAGHNLDVTLLPNAARFYRLGLHDIGAANSLVLQIGGRFNPSLLWRAGVFESQVGVGLDYQMTNPLWLSFDLYNVNLLTLDVVGKYYVTPRWRITLGGRNLLRQPGLVFGLGTSF
jgi:phospholipid/cholesterol/gamma-HCH transport system substrate-binding protein